MSMTEDEVIEQYGKIETARRAICGNPWIKGAGTARGTIDCPICLQHNSLCYIRSENSVSAKCKTENCVSWSE